MYYLNNTTYNEKTLMGRLRRYFLIYFETFSVSTADSLFLLIFSILALESAHSIRFLYHHFLSGITKKSLNVFIMPEFLSKEHVIILCDSWYTKKNLVSIIDEYPNLDLIGNARIDSVMYDLAPERTGRRGRPAKHGKRLCVETDFTFSKEKIGDYYTGVRRVFTKIFGDREVLAYVTDTEKGNGTKRLFFSTIFSEDLKVFCTEEEHSSSDQTDHDPVNYIRCYYMPFDGRSKSATMNRKRSGLFATIWYGVARE